MQFVVIAFDGKDEDAPNRCLNARPEHLRVGNELLEAGNFWYGAAEPYMISGVWKEIQIHGCNVRDPWIFNRPKEFFEKRSCFKQV